MAHIWFIQSQLNVQTYVHGTYLTLSYEVYDVPRTINFGGVVFELPPNVGKNIIDINGWTMQTSNSNLMLKIELGSNDGPFSGYTRIDNYNQHTRHTFNTPNTIVLSF
jgi:hypothetical protein